MNKKIIGIFILCLSFFFISGVIDLNNLFEYSAQRYPTFIDDDNMPLDNITTDAGATLGRVLFYDKNLSVNNTIACASCHRQEFAFGDTATVSIGLHGESTGRHSMRLINARFGDELHFFWDERANSLEDQVSQPIQDHIEMGFSGFDGTPDLDSLIRKMSTLPHYQQLFPFVFGDSLITEVRIQKTLAQFIRSIQSFDSKFDIGRNAKDNNIVPFDNFTPTENLGKSLFLRPQNNGGAGCIFCHQPPAFDIAPNSLNNGVITVAGNSDAIDLNNTRAPSLRELVNPNGILNGPLMHDGSFTSLMQVINHYNQIPDNPLNTNLDPRLRTIPNGPPQNLQLTTEEKQQLIAFLGTLTGTAVYTSEQWSNPFDDQGNIIILELMTNTIPIKTDQSFIQVFPNPFRQQFTVKHSASHNLKVKIYDTQGKLVRNQQLEPNQTIYTADWASGNYWIELWDETGKKTTKKLIKR